MIQMQPEGTIAVVLIVMFSAVLWYEYRSAIIPDAVTIPGILIGLALHYILAPHHLFTALVGAAVGFLLPMSLATIYSKSTGREGLGGGIVKLLAMIGAFLGWQGVIVAIVVGSILGVLHGIVKLSIRPQVSKVIEFGPHLIVGSLFYMALKWVFYR